MPDIFDPVKCTQAGHPAVDRWNTVINTLAPMYGVPPNLVKAHILYESGGDPTIVSFDQGCGLGQITSGVKRIDGVYLYDGADILQPYYNVQVMCRDFIKGNMEAFPGDLDAVIAAYNAGVGAVQAALNHGRDPSSATYGAWYVPKVRDAFAWFNEESHKVLDVQP